MPNTGAALSPASAATDELFAAGTVTIAGLKAEFGIPRATAYELMTKGKLAYSQIGRRRLIPRRAVHQLLAEGLVGVDFQAGK